MANSLLKQLKIANIIIRYRNSLYAPKNASAKFIYSV